MNDPFSGLMKILKPDCYVIMAGVSTPLSPILFSIGVDILSGTIITEPEGAMKAVESDASFREVKKHARLINFVDGLD